MSLGISRNHVYSSQIQAFGWTWCSAAIAVTGGRYYLRWRYFGAAKWDDLINGLALASLIGSVETDMVATYSDDILWTKANIASSTLMWTTLYLVKATFLSLFWFIFNVSERFRKAGWVVTIYTFLTYWPIVLSEIWKCGSPSDYDNPGMVFPDTYSAFGQISIFTHSLARTP